MGFPPELWFEDVENLGEISGNRPSWFLDRDNKLVLLDEEVVEALRDETVRACCAKSSACRSGREELCWGSCGSSKGRAGRFGERLEKGGVTPLPT